MDVSGLQKVREEVVKTLSKASKSFDLHVEAMGGLRLRIHAYKGHQRSKIGHQPKLPGVE